MKRIILYPLLFIASVTFAQSGKTKVTWIIRQSVQSPCPNVITEDEYGRNPNKNTTTTQSCFQYVWNEKQIEFDSEKEADEFYDKLVKEKESQFQLKSQFIETVKIEKQ